MIVLLVVCGAEGRAEDAKDEASAATAIRKVGGTIESEDGHVVAVNLGGDKIDGDKITDAILEHLKKFSRLRSLKIGRHPKITNAGQSRVTEAGVNRLQEKLPKLDIYYR